MDNLEKFSALVEGIHSVPFVEEGWASIPGEVVDLLDSGWAQVHVTDFNGPGSPLSILHPLESSALNQYVKHYTTIDPRAAVLTRRDNIPRPRADIVSSESALRRWTALQGCAASLPYSCILTSASGISP